MRKFKYIMFGFFTPVLFPEHIKHSDFANLCHFGKPTSAGFAKIYIKPDLTYKEEHEIDVCTFGESVSLKLKSDKEDARVIKNMIMDSDLDV